MTEDPASPPRYPTGSRRALIMAASTTAAMLVTVDSTIANVALTHIQASLSASQDQVVWVLTSYMIATAIGTIITNCHQKNLIFAYGPTLMHQILNAAGFRAN